MISCRSKENNLTSIPRAPLFPPQAWILKFFHSLTFVFLSSLVHNITVPLPLSPFFPPSVLSLPPDRWDNWSSLVSWGQGAPWPHCTPGSSVLWLYTAGSPVYISRVHPRPKRYVSDSSGGEAAVCYNTWLGVCPCWRSTAWHFYTPFADIRFKGARPKDIL